MFRRVAVERLKWTILLVAAVLGAYLVKELVEYLAWGAKNIYTGGDSYFTGSVRRLAFGGFQVGAIPTLFITTMVNKRRLWLALRNITILMWVFVFLDACATFTVP